MTNNPNPQNQTPLSNPLNVSLFKQTKTSLIISLVIFLLCIASLLFLIQFISQSDHGWDVLLVFAYFIIISHIILISFIVAIVSTIFTFRCRKHGILISPEFKALEAIALLQIPIFCLLSLGAFNLAQQIHHQKYIAIMEQHAAESYGDHYTILGGCYNLSGISTEPSRDSLVINVSLDGFAYPITGSVSKSRDYPYQDNRARLEAADKLGYQNYLKQLFGPNTVAIMELGKKTATSTSSASTESQKTAYLGLLLEKSQQTNSQLKANLTNLVDRYLTDFDIDELNLSLFLTDQIDQSKLRDYYIQIGNHYFCSDGAASSEELGIKQVGDLYFDADDSDREITLRINNLIQSLNSNTIIKPDQT